MIKILIQQEAPKEIRPEYKKVPLCKKVDWYIRNVESNQIDSEREWEYLKRLYEKISRKKNITEEHEKILSKLEELFEKYGNHDHSGSVDLDSEYMHRGD